MSTKLFVQVKYGNTTVYMANTTGQLKAIFEMIVANLKDWDLEAEIEATRAVIEKGKGREMYYVNAIKHLLEQIDIGSHEAFEHGTGFTNLQNEEL